MAKSLEVKTIMDQIAKRLNPASVGYEKSLERSICTLCTEDASTFKDELSKREYRISGMCQVCQDKMF